MNTKSAVVESVVIACQFYKKLPVFQKGCTIFYSHQQFMSDQVSLHPYFCSSHCSFFLSNVPNFLLSSYPFCFKVFLQLFYMGKSAGNRVFQFSFILDCLYFTLFPEGQFCLIESAVESSFLSTAENYLLIKLPRKGETSLENSSETMHYPASLGNISGPDTNCSLSISPNFGKFEMIHIKSSAV